MARLKVFTWSDGFHAFTVAASSRAKALAAWGMDADIFKSGLAHEIDSGPDHDAALASPEQVIKRGLAVDAGVIVAAPKRATKAPSKAAREKVSRLAAELEALDADHAARVEALERRREALEVEAARAVADHDKARRDLVSKLKAARAKL